MASLRVCLIGSIFYIHPDPGLKFGVVLAGVPPHVHAKNQVDRPKEMSAAMVRARRRGPLLSQKVDPKADIDPKSHIALYGE